MRGVPFNLFPFFALVIYIFSFYSIYMHLLSNHNLYLRCSFGPTISSSPKIISHIPLTKQLISFILVFEDFFFFFFFFVYKELHLNNRIFFKCWRIFLNTLELWLWYYFNLSGCFIQRTTSSFVNLMMMVIDNVMYLIIYFYVNITLVWRHLWCC